MDVVKNKSIRKDSVIMQREKERSKESCYQPLFAHHFRPSECEQPAFLVITWAHYSTAQLITPHLGVIS